MTNREPFGLAEAVVFGLAYAASLHAARSGKYAGADSERILAPTVDAIKAVRQWRHTAKEEP